MGRREGVALLSSSSPRTGPPDVAAKRKLGTRRRRLRRNPAALERCETVAGGEGTLAEEGRNGRRACKKGRRPRAAVVSGVVSGDLCASGQDEPAKQQPV
jgi:hypothetical protein